MYQFKQIISYFKKNILTIILFILIFALLGFFFGLWIFYSSFIIAVKNFSNFYTFLSTIVMVYVTFLYFLTTKELVKKNEQIIEINQKTELQKIKNIAKQLLLEINYNDFQIRFLEYSFGANDILIKNFSELIETNFYRQIYKDKLRNTVYKNYLEQCLYIDFNDVKLSGSLNLYYAYIDNIKNCLIGYNNIVLDSNSYNYKKNSFSSLIKSISTIKNNNFNQNIIKRLEKESSFTLKDNGLLFKPNWQPISELRKTMENSK